MVELAYNSLKGFGLTEKQKDDLIKLLQGNEQEQAKREARKALKPISEKKLKEFEEVEKMADWLIANHFKYHPPNWDRRSLWQVVNTKI